MTIYDVPQYAYRIVIADDRTGLPRAHYITAPDISAACGYAGWLMDWRNPGHERVTAATEAETLLTRADLDRVNNAIEAGTYAPRPVSQPSDQSEYPRYHFPMERRTRPPLPDFHHHDDD